MGKITVLPTSGIRKKKNKLLELKCDALTAFINLDTAGIACDSLHIKKRTGLFGVEPASVTKKCDNDVRLGFLWASAGLRFS